MIVYNLNHKKVPVSMIVYIVRSNKVKTVDGIHNVIPYLKDKKSM
uniref:Uncharacterized protein n=1 Tax=Lepeophtheirus salmonis TaxID=72036 RepID=A0A0K2VC76_LEPSM